MRIARISNFITKEEQVELYHWFEANENIYFKPAFNNFKDNYKFRLSSRRVPDVDFPEITQRIFDRIKSSFEFTSDCRVEESEFTKGIIGVITKPGGFTFAHKDVPQCENLSVIRFNIVIQKPTSGGELWVKDGNGTDIEVAPAERELHAYNVSDYLHAVSLVEGEVDRYIILFSMCCKKEDWETKILNKETPCQIVKNL